MNESLQPRRRWFRFRTRTLLVVVAVVAVPLAWIANERAQSAYEVGVARKLREQGVEMVELWGPYFSIELFLAHEPQPRYQELTNDVMGRRVYIVARAPADFSDLAPLARFTNLQVLNIPSTQIRDLAPLARQRKLTRLFVNSTQITDLSPLAKINSLRVLDISNTAVRDFTPLLGLTNLESLDVAGTPLTTEQLETLHKALPKCEITYTAVDANE